MSRSPSGARTSSRGDVAAQDARRATRKRAKGICLRCPLPAEGPSVHCHAHRVEQAGKRGEGGEKATDPESSIGPK